MGKHGSIPGGIPSPDIKQLPIIPFDNEPHYRKKNPTVTSGTSLKTETGKMQQLKSHPNMPSKDKESTRLSQDIWSSWFLTEADYAVPIGDKPTESELDAMEKLKRICHCTKREVNYNEK